MDECCSINAAPSSHCVRCGAKGRAVSLATLMSLLKPEALERLTTDQYNFDPSPECEVVYFSNAANSYFVKDDLTVRVGIKEKDEPIPLCYCFGHTLETARAEIVATGISTVSESITREIQAETCECGIRNPSGACCLGEVHKAIDGLLDDMQSRAIEPGRKQ